MAEPGSTIRWGRLILCAALGAFVAALPTPDGLRPEAWRVFAVFTGVVLAFILRPLDMAPAVLIGIIVLATSGTVELKVLLESGFGHSTVWLVVAAFLIADAVEETGLGRRIALLLLRALGRSILGLAYAIAATELVLAPFIPSNTARGGGIIAPVVRGLAETLGSTPRESPRLAGAYLVQVGGHANLVTSAMFLTAMAGNGLVPPAVRDVFGVNLDYGTWLQGSIVPGLASLLLVPIVLRFLEPPEAIDMAAVRARVAVDLRTLGPARREEKLLAGLLLALFLIWSAGPAIQSYLRVRLADPTTAALIGVVALVFLRIRTWRQVAGSWRAWDAYLWLGGFVALAEALKGTGFTTWLGARVEALLPGGDVITSVILLGIVYFATMYLFSQLTAHIAALAAVFLAVAKNVGSPPLLAAGIIAYFSCLCGATTPWSSGPVIIYFQQGYVSAGRWMRNGIGVAVLQITLWLTVGMAWWKWLGWW